jgi:hypothetical protein
MESGGPLGVVDEQVVEVRAPADDAHAADRLLSPGLYAGVSLLLADAVWLVVATFAKLSVTLWFAGHVAVVGAVAMWAWRRRGRDEDISGPALTLMAVLVAGPLGGLLAVIAVRWLETRQPDTTLLANWYERIALAGDIDPVTRLCNTVSMGRAVQTTKDMPKVFATVMADGSLEDRQTALGLIARRFWPSYAPALRAALVSSEPVIRVQAAAVAVKVRGDLKAMLGRALVQSRVQGLTPRATLELAAEIQAIVAAEMLEDADRELAVACLTDLIAAGVYLLGEQNAADAALTLSPAARALLETELLARGHFDTFRAVRRAVDQIQLVPRPLSPGVERTHGG